MRVAKKKVEFVIIFDQFLPYCDTKFKQMRSHIVEINKI